MYQRVHLQVLQKLTFCSRHRRTHEARPDGEIGYTDDDLEAEENEFGALDDGTPSPDEPNSYMQSQMTSMTANSMRMPTTGMGHDGMTMTGAMGPPLMSNQMPVSQQI